MDNAEWVMKVLKGTPKPSEVHRERYRLWTAVLQIPLYGLQQQAMTTLTSLLI